MALAGREAKVGRQRRTWLIDLDTRSPCCDSRIEMEIASVGPCHFMAGSIWFAIELHLCAEGGVSIRGPLIG